MSEAAAAGKAAGRTAAGGKPVPAPGTIAVAASPGKEQTPFQRNFAAYCESRIAVTGLAVLVLLCLVALFAPWIA
ncbi:MAG: hypothetical protein H0T52_13805, partial [Lautropia sp.]|nr:hypothetical protein [Lautropia sp.]